MADYQNIIVETHGRVGLIRLNRPAALNALCDALMEELGTQLLAFDNDTGIGAIVLNGAKIGKGSVIAAGAMVPEGAEIPPDSMVMGVPAKVKRETTPEERERFRLNALHYVEAARIYKEESDA